MADIIKKSTNKFTKGLIMDFSPENTQNEVLTHALNATLLTFNGNELSLLNDMGNGRVETAFLPEGYMPVGTCEYGGIIYIVSYNPLEDKSLIGCFPSPERNISNDELGISDAKIAKDSFLGFTTITNEEGTQEKVPNGTIKNTTLYVLLKNSNLNPGDKFLICSEKDLLDEQLSDLKINGSLKENPIIALNVVSIEDSGKITYLNSDLRQYEINNTYTVDDITKTDTYSYHILAEAGANELGFDLLAVDIDSYRNVLSSGYSVFKSKTSGKLAILAELLMIDSYSVTHNIVPKKDENGNTLDGRFDICIYTDVTPNIEDPDRYSLTPKLKYYHLEKSLGYLQMFEGFSEIRVPLFEISEDDKGNSSTTKKLNRQFFETYLNEIYTPTFSSGINLNQKLETSGKFNFPKNDTYHGTMNLYNGSFVEGSVPENVFIKFTEGVYHRIKKDQIAPRGTDGLRDYSVYTNYYLNEVNARFYYYDKDGKSYELFTGDEIDESLDYFTKEMVFDYIDVNHNQVHRSKTLYIINTPVQIAQQDVINNKSIEKYKYDESTIYKKVDINDPKLDTRNIWVLVKDGDNIKYNKHTGTLDPDLTYYTPVLEKVLVSLGYIVDEQYLNTTIYYYPITKLYEQASQEVVDSYWADPDSKVVLYYREPREVYKPASAEEITNYKELGIELYYNTFYHYLDFEEFKTFEDSFLDVVGTQKWFHRQLFIQVPMDTYVTSKKFYPSKLYNWIDGYSYNPNSENNTNSDEIFFIEWEYPENSSVPEWSEEDGYPITGPDLPKNAATLLPIEYPKEKPIGLYTVADFIPSNTGDENYLKYCDLKLGNIKIPYVLTTNGIDLPFKYDYTIVPCMNYGRLEHLKVSNTVDFSKLHAFNQSNFNEWRYHIDGNQLRLTFGADVFDTYETDKVDGLILEFYDLWGFAGSIEITDKKAYSGIYTKIIPLNGLNGIGKKKISGNLYITTYKRSVSIVPKTNAYNTFSCNGYDVSYGGADYGWGVEDKDNDCGTLYSNLLYGVKTYLRRTKNKGTESEEMEFIKKKDFFLYTFPILNDYYYNVLNFNDITHPKLQMMLTYKLLNSGTVLASDRSPLVNGYTSGDNNTVKLYTSGLYEGSNTLNATKYYNFTGSSNLYLEVGLKKDYEDFRLSYSPDINKLFTCKLKLISDEDPNYTFSIKYDENNPVPLEDALGYMQGETPLFNKDINTLVFKKGDVAYNELNLSTTGNTGDVYKANFISSSGTSPINIKYDFTVGYKINISNIRTTSVPATTICALFHKNPETLTYNYEDFGVYILNEGGTDKYFSKAMIFNRGTVFSEDIGICRQIASTGAMNVLCLEDFIYSQTTADIQTAGKHCTGEPIRQILPYIGKLTFCQPHAHATNETLGVNIWYSNNSTLGISVNTGTHYYRDDGKETDGRETKHKETSLGIRPCNHLRESPLYNMVLNTVNMINYLSEFYSTLQYAKTSGEIGGYISNYNKNIRYPSYWREMRKFTGFTGALIEKFNKRLIKTMENVYAYNPDYDLLPILTGDVNIQDHLLQFTSNLLSIDSNFAFGVRTVSGEQIEETLNDYVYIGPIQFSKYLLCLNTYSEDNSGYKILVSLKIFVKQGSTSVERTTPLDQVYLKPDLTYCGKPDSYYLITSLTYNVPVPQELHEEISFKGSSLVVIKKSDGSNVIVQGTPSKKVLYGGKTQNGIFKLVLLDVNNYTINQSTGELSVNRNVSESDPMFISVLPTYSFSSVSSNVYTVSKGLNVCFAGTSITINDLVYDPKKDGHRLFMRNGCCSENKDPRNIIYYRSTLDTEYDTWNAWEKYQHKNHLYIMTGPCFTSI